MYNKPQESFAELFASETIREVPETLVKFMHFLSFLCLFY